MIVGYNFHGKRNNLAAKERLPVKGKTSRQKEKTHGKRKNLTAKRLTTAKVEDSYKSVYDFVQLK